MCIHNRLHMSLLKLWVPNNDLRYPSCANAEPGPIMGEDSKDCWFVDRILNRVLCGHGYCYLVYWRGYDKGSNSSLSVIEVRNLVAFGNWLKENELDQYQAWANAHADSPKDEMSHEVENKMALSNFR